MIVQLMYNGDIFLPESEKLIVTLVDHYKWERANIRVRSTYRVELEPFEGCRNLYNESTPVGSLGKGAWFTEFKAAPSLLFCLDQLHELFGCIPDNIYFKINEAL